MWIESKGTGSFSSLAGKKNGIRQKFAKNEFGCSPTAKPVARKWSCVTCNFFLF
jgi:hypothetical protein